MCQIGRASNEDRKLLLISNIWRPPLHRWSETTSAIILRELIPPPPLFLACHDSTEMQFHESSKGCSLSRVPSNAKSGFPAHVVNELLSHFLELR